MLDELLPTGLTAAARKLGVEPLEVVRLMVVSDTISPGFTMTDDHLRKLAEVGDIASGWWRGVELPDDEIPVRQRVRAMLGILLARSADGPVRMDNLWRGLPVDDQELVEEALRVLAEEGLVEIRNTVSGIRVGVLPARVAEVQALVEGTAQSAGLNELYQE